MKRAVACLAVFISLAGCGVASKMIIASAVPPAASADDRSDADVDELDALNDALDSDEARPGDEALSCDQLAAELTATMSEVEVQDAMKQLGTPEALLADFKQRKDKLDATGAAIVAVRMMAKALSWLPGAGDVTGIVEGALTSRADRQARAIAAEAAEKLKVIEPIAPQLNRVSHVADLADEKGCPFMEEFK